MACRAEQLDRSAIDGAAALPRVCRVQVLLLAMLEPRSYTAEDVIEIHTHGGGISAQRVLQVRLGGWAVGSWVLGQGGCITMGCCC